MTTINKDAGNIYRLLLVSGISEKFAAWIVAQAAHETANFTSYIYRHNLNAFGMKYNGQAEAQGERNGYAWYNDYRESVNDYKRLFDSYGIKWLIEIVDFVNLLKRNKYFEASIEEYLAGVTYFNKLYFPDGKIHPDLKISGAGGTW